MTFCMHKFTTNLPLLDPEKEKPKLRHPTQTPIRKLMDKPFAHSNVCTLLRLWSLTSLSPPVSDQVHLSTLTPNQLEGVKYLSF